MIKLRKSGVSGESGISRRTFLKALGAIGGNAAVFNAMSAWRLLQTAAQEQPPQLGGGGNGTRVIILGAGPAGCTTGYELMNNGYDVQILEAHPRVGGHVYTVRRGDTLEEYGGEQQTCQFDEGQFWDAGAWRIPYTHRGTLHYTKEFGIPLQPHKNMNLNAYVYMENVENNTFSNQKMRIRQMKTDMGGYTAELLAKAVDQGQLDQDLTQEDRDNLVDYLIEEGLLSRNDLTYNSSYHRGYAELPSAGTQPGKVSDPFPFADLLPYAAEALRSQGYYLASTSSLYQQETMLQPVNGMGQIYEEGFQQALGDRLVLNAEVTEIRQGQDGVRIVYTDRESGQPQEVTGDYCVSTLPLSVLQNIPADFSSEMSNAITQIPYFAAGKIGLQMARRFWEEDDWIYGGLTLTNIPEVGVIAYPDYNYQAQKGVIQGYYNLGPDAIKVSGLSPQDRVELALEHGSKIHPQYRDEFENGISVAWHRVPYALGAWPAHSERTRAQFYERLLEPDGRIYLAGEFMSYVTAWQEGAISAAWMQTEKLHQRVMQEG